VAVAHLALDLGVELNTIQKSGSWFSYNGNKLGQGRDAVKQLIEDNPELMEELEKKIKEKVAGSLTEEQGEKEKTTKEKPVLEKARG
jgi:recombination protein RecA